MDRLRNRVEPFAALFWALGNVQYCSQHLTLFADPASLHCRIQSMSLYGHSWFNYQRRRAGPPPSYLGMLFIYSSLLHPPEVRACETL